MEDSPLSLSKAMEQTSSGSLLSSASSTAQQWINPSRVNTKRKLHIQQFVLHISHDPKLCMAHIALLQYFENKTFKVFFQLHLRGSHPPISLRGSRLYHMLQVLRRVWLFVLLAHSTITSSGRNCKSSGITFTSRFWWLCQFVCNRTDRICCFLLRWWWKATKHKRMTGLLFFEQSQQLGRCFSNFLTWRVGLKRREICGVVDCCIHTDTKQKPQRFILKWI